jgi:hypothetical protein
MNQVLSPLRSAARQRNRPPVGIPDQQHPARPRKRRGSAAG